MKFLYTRPQIVFLKVFLEECIVSGSVTTSFGGSGGSAFPDIEDETNATDAVKGFDFQV